MRIITVFLVGALVVGLAAAQKQTDDLEYDDDYDYDNETPAKDTPVKDTGSTKKDIAKDNKTKQPVKGAAVDDEVDDDEDGPAKKNKPDNPTSLFLKPRNTRNKLQPTYLQRPKPTLPPFIKPRAGGAPLTTSAPRPTQNRSVSSRSTTTTTRKPKRGASTTQPPSRGRNSRATTEAPAKESGRRFGGSSSSKSKPSRYNRDN